MFHINEENMLSITFVYVHYMGVFTVLVYRESPPLKNGGGLMCWICVKCTGMSASEWCILVVCAVPARQEAGQ